MNKTPNSPRVISSMVAVAFLGLIVGSPAWGDLFGSYKVPLWKYTNSNHRWAIYAVANTTPPSDKAILVFVEFRGDYEDQVFICDDAVWNGDKETYSCSRSKPIDQHVITETVTIGDINGKFCNDLRNNTDIRKKIIKPEDCRNNKKCSCYQVTWDDPERREFAPSPGAGSGTGN